MKGLISIWLTLWSILDGIKGSIRHHSKSLQHWNVWLKWARRPAQPNPTEWRNSARDIGHCTLICKWALVWSLPGGQTHYLQETRIRPSTQPQLHCRDTWGVDTFTVGQMCGTCQLRSVKWLLSEATVQCPRAELQSWGVGMMKGWVGIGMRDNKQETRTL